MNQTFSFPRFLLLVKAEYAEKGRIQLLTAGLLLAFLLILMLPIIIAKEFGGIISGFHILALLIVVLFGGGLFTDLSFSQYGPREKAMAALMVPASRLEKLLTPLVLNMLFIIPLMVLFVVLHYWTIEFANARLPDTSQKYREMPLHLLLYFLTISMVIYGAIFLGSLYFVKSSYAKTVAVFIVIIVSFLVVNRGIVHFLLADTSPSVVSAVPFFGWDIVYKTPMYKSFHVGYTDGTENVVYPLLILLVLSLWYITYVRLKEKEI